MWGTSVAQLSVQLLVSAWFVFSGSWGGALRPVLRGICLGPSPSKIKSSLKIFFFCFVLFKEKNAVKM